MLELHALFASKRPRPNLVTETENVAADNIHVSFTHKKKKNIYIYIHIPLIVSLRPNMCKIVFYFYLLIGHAQKKA